MNRQELVELIERWARYRIDRQEGNGWPRQVILGKMRDGMPGMNCPGCGGQGKRQISVQGGIAQYIPCPTCKGGGKVKLDPGGNKINPMFIPSTATKYAQEDEKLMMRIDWLICTELTEDQRIVVMAEFTWNGNRNQKIAKLKIRHSTFNDELEEAYSRLNRHLGE